MVGRFSRAHRAPRTSDVPHSQADGRRLAELFPDVKPVPLTEGLRAMVSWFQAHVTLAPAAVLALRIDTEPPRRGASGSSYNRATIDG